MSNLLSYKCPCCGGEIEFDTSLQEMKCPYCDTTFDVAALKEYDDTLNTPQEDTMQWETEPGTQWEEGEEDNISVYICNSCGGEIVGDDTTAATACPFCGSPVIMTGKLSGALKPDFVIPFKLDKKQAKQGLLNHLKGKLLLPNVFKDQNHIDEIKGIYVPFWLFDADTNANIHYKGTKSRTWSDSNYIYHETRYYAIHRAGTLSFDRVPVDGSSKMADDLMQSIEPFNFSEAVDFQTAYLSGFFADKYDVSAQDSIETANSRIKRSTENAFRNTVHGFNTVIPEHTQLSLQNGSAKYALYPVWILNTTWNNQKYTFAMNGQTGKFVGNLPLDKRKFFSWLGGLGVGLSAVIYALLFLFNNIL